MRPSSAANPHRRPWSKGALPRSRPWRASHVSNATCDPRDPFEPAAQARVVLASAAGSPNDPVCSRFVRSAGGGQCLVVGVRRAACPRRSRVGVRAWQSDGGSGQGPRRVRPRRGSNPDLHLNEGNAQVLAGQLPDAILAYQRGMRLAPSDSRLRDNLTYVRQRIAYPGEHGRPPASTWPSWLPQPSTELLVI